MKDASGGRLYGRTRWRRFAVILGPALGVVAVLMVLVANGVVAVSFAISGIPFKLNATNLSGTGFVQYATVDPVTNVGSGALLPAGSSQTVGGTTYDAATVTVLATASISGLDQTICAPIPGPLGAALHNLLVELKAGSTTPVSASNLVVDAPSLLASGNATFTNINIGQDAGNALGGSNNGVFSQAAQSVSIDGLTQVAIGTSAGSFTLPGLSLNASFVSSCP